MNCLKCGREVEENQVYCSRCLEKMAQYPIKPDIRVHIPQRANSPAPRKPAHRRRVINPEEQILRLHTHMRRLIITTVVLSLLLVTALGFLGKILLDRTAKRDTGRNYNIQTTCPNAADPTP